MVIECQALPGFGALRFASEFMQETLQTSSRRRPWMIVESPDQRRIFVAGLPREVRMAVAEGRVFWVRAQNRADLPELVLLLLRSSLCEGVFLRGLEEHDIPRAQLWMRRWQLESERVGTHVLWVHEEPSQLVGPQLRLEWSDAQTIQVKKGWQHIFQEGYAVFQKLKSKIKEREASHVNRSTERVA